MSDTKENTSVSSEKKISVEEEVNSLRIKYLTADIIWKSVSIVVFVATVTYIVLVFKKVLDFELLVSSIIILVLLSAIFVCIYLLPHFLKMNSKHRAYSTKYKEAFLKPVLEEAFSKGEYTDYEKISTRDLTRNSMLKKAKSAIANDCVRGVYKKIPFLRYDLALRYGKKKAGSDCVMIVAQVKTRLKHEVQIIGNDFKIGGMDYEQPETYCKILSSHEKFDSKFSVYAKDQDDGQKFLKESIAAKIVKFKPGGPIALFFDKDEVSLIVRKNKDAMEAPVYRNVKKSKALKEANEEVEIIKEWIEILEDCL
ncbi:MAG: DUF3137 domain-containing protein [Lachnospiraceae bacterium]|nr:DUF3137 domain-containing protein [Lachnospiraceae bacterium]